MIVGIVEPCPFELQQPWVTHILPSLNNLDSALYATLTSQSGLQVHRFSDFPSRPVRTLDLQRFVDERRIEWKHLAMFPQLVTQDEYVFLAGATMSASTGVLRSLGGELHFPICNFVQPMVGSDGLGTLAVDLLRAAPCDVWLTDSPAARDALRETAVIAGEWQGLIPATTPRIEVIQRAVDCERFKPRPRAECRQTLQLPPDGLVLLHTVPPLRGCQPDLEPLLVAFREAVGKRRDVTLLVATTGGAATLANCDKAMSQLGLGDRVKLLPDVGPHLIPLLCAGADVFISLDVALHDAADITLLEAMASGAAVIAADWHSSRALVESGVTGLLVPTIWNPIAAAMMSWTGVGESGNQFLADRTPVDLAVLTEHLVGVIAQDEQRRSLGQAARAYVESNHAAPVIGRRVSALWAEQREVFRDMPSARQPRLDYGRLFAHYARSVLKGDTAIAITARGRELFGDDLRPGNTAGVPSMLLPATMRVLEVIQAGPQSIDRCTAVDDTFSLEAIVWMLRKGYACIATANQGFQMKVDPLGYVHQ